MDFAISERPNKIVDIVGNTSVKNTLQSALDNDCLPQAIMFTGESSSGKTTVINCLKNELEVDELNFHEIDCGLTTSIEDSRAIAETMRFTPFGGYDEKVLFVLEECHKLSSNKKAQEGYLRLLENLPSNVYVFASTTNPELLLPQFRNRFLQLNMKTLTDKELALGIIKPLCEKYDFRISKDILMRILELSQGVPRTALHLLYSIHHLPVEEQSIVLEDESKDTVDFFKVINSLLSYDGDGSIKDFIYYKKTLLYDGEVEKVRKVLLKQAEKKLQSCDDELVVNNCVHLYECFGTVDYDNVYLGFCNALYKFLKK